MPNWKLYLKSIALPLGLGVLVAFLLRDSFHYDNLVKPSLVPPAFLFPIVWTILYTLMGVSYGILVSKGVNTSDTQRIYYIQLAVNLLWSVCFFGLEMRFLAFVWILLLDILVILMIRLFYEQNKVAGLIQIPYLIWLIYATILNYQAYILN